MPSPNRFLERPFDFDAAPITLGHLIDSSESLLINAFRRLHRETLAVTLPALSLVRDVAGRGSVYY